MQHFRFPHPPEDFSSKKSKFDKFVSEHPDLPTVMLNWNFYNEFVKEFHFDYASEGMVNTEFFLLIEALITGQNRQKNKDTIISFINTYLPNFEDIDFRQEQTIAKFLNNLITIKNRHLLPENSKSQRWFVSES